MAELGPARSRTRCVSCGHVSAEVVGSGSRLGQHLLDNPGHVALMEMRWEGDSEWTPTDVYETSASEQKVYRARFCQEVVDPAVRASAEAVDGGDSHSMDFSACCKCGRAHDLVVTIHGSGAWVLAIASEYGVKVRRARALTLPTLDDERATATRDVPLCKQCAPQHWVREHERRPVRIVAVEPGTEESFAEGLVKDEKNRRTLAAGGKWYGGFYTNGRHEIVAKGVFATRREAEEALTFDKPGWALRYVRELPPDGVVKSWPDDENARLIPAPTILRKRARMVSQGEGGQPAVRAPSDAELEEMLKVMATCVRCGAKRSVREMFFIIKDVLEGPAAPEFACPSCAAGWARPKPRH